MAAKADEKPVGEYSSVGENSPSSVGENALLAKIQKPLESNTKDFSPMHFSPMPDKDFSPIRKTGAGAEKRDFSPIKKREFSPMTSPAKKPKLALVGAAKNGRRGRPRNPQLPPAPDKYFYWTKAGNGLKLEKRKPEYEYIGFIMPNEWEHLRGNFDEEYILRAIVAAIRIKRARAAESRRPRALTA